MGTEEIIDNQGDAEIDYKALYEESKTELETREEKVNELESLIQKHKKAPKEKKGTEDKQTFGESDITKMLDEREFYKNNPEFTEHKEAIDKFTSKGLGFDEAKVLVMNNDTTIQARQNAKNSNFTAGTPDFNKTSYSQDELKALPQHEYNKVMEMKGQGKVYFT